MHLLDSPFDPGEWVARFGREVAAWGAMASVVGQVRADEDVEALELTHYAPLTLRGMEELADAALERSAIAGLLVVHRIGVLHPGEPIVCVAAAARHRRAAIEAVDFAMDHLKSASWLWKRERRAGTWHWVEPRDEDHADRARWQ